MAYETKLIIGERQDDGYVSVIATVDLCAMGAGHPLAELHREYLKDRSERSVYFYGWDGNTRMDEDLYGDRLVGIPIKEAQRELVRAMGLSDYRRNAMGFDVVRSVINTFSEQELSQIVVICWGH